MAGLRERGPAIVFVALLVVAFPLLLFRLGSYHWFLRDDWLFISGRGVSWDDVFRPAAAHWSTLPVLVYRALWSTVGLQSYRPYQAVAVALHLVSALLVWVVMRHAGVRGWLATAAAAALVLFGPGEQNIVWAFGLTFAGSLAFGLGQLVLADHDGSAPGRDVAALACGLFALLCSGVGITLVVAVTIAVLCRRGWRAAALQSLPLAAIFLVYVAVEHPLLNPYGRPSPGVAWRWIRTQLANIFGQLGHFELLGVVLAVVLVVGTVFAVRDRGFTAFRRRNAAAVGLAGGALFFAITTAFGRWEGGEVGATASRYVHLGAAFLLPALAVAANAIIDRWRAAYIPLVVLFLLPVPWNAASFESTVFDHNYFAAEKAAILPAPRAPYASEVPADVRPFVDPLMGSVTMGFLRDALRDGKLPDYVPLTPSQSNELRVRLGVAQSRDAAPPTPCRTVPGNLDVTPARGSILVMRTPVTIGTHDGAKRTSFPIVFDPQLGEVLRIELDDLPLRFAPPPGQSTFELCGI